MDTATTIEVTRAFLAGFYTFVAVFYILRLGNKRTGGKTMVFAGQRFSGTWWNHMVFRSFRVLIWCVCVLRVFFPSFDNYLGIFTPMLQWPILVLGNVLLIVGFVFTVLVHRSMGNLWRSGIDPSGPTELKTDSFFQFSRNPMFVSVGLAQLGFFLALPSAFSLVCLILGWLALHRQVIAEESHLANAFAYQYQNYKSRVPRWL